MKRNVATGLAAAALCCLLAGPIAGCSASESAPDGAADAGGDLAPLPDAGAPDAGRDASPPDAAASCSLVAPRLGATPEAVALAKAPARCGQPAHVWLDSPQLGEITASRSPESADAMFARIALTAAGIEIPETVHDVVTEQIAYRTQDRGALHEATALLAYPTKLAGDTDFDVLLVLHGTAGFNDSCAPSNEAELRQLLAAIAALGYVVVHPDYIGLRAFGEPSGFLHPYLVGQATAIASLDAVRAAARRLAEVTREARSADRSAPRVCAGTRFATIGGSQGGHAALWVDRLWPYYAPELEHAGAAATVPPSAVYDHMVTALRSLVPATESTIALFGASSGWYGVADRLGEVFLPPVDTELPAALHAGCNADDVLEGKGLAEIFQPSLLEAASKEGDAGLIALSPWGCIAAENSLVRTSIARQPPAAGSYGVLFVLGEKDPLVDPAIERPAFDALCAQGMKLQYLECAGASHTGATKKALPEILDFVRDRLAGKAIDPAQVCKRGPATTCRGNL